MNIEIGLSFLEIIQEDANITGMNEGGEEAPGKRPGAIWERPWTVEEMKKGAGEWSLASDAGVSSVEYSKWNLKNNTIMVLISIDLQLLAAISHSGSEFHPVNLVL